MKLVSLFCAVLLAAVLAAATACTPAQGDAGYTGALLLLIPEDDEIAGWSKSGNTVGGAVTDLSAAGVITRIVLSLFMPEGR